MMAQLEELIGSSCRGRENGTANTHNAATVLSGRFYARLFLLCKLALCYSAQHHLIINHVYHNYHHPRQLVIRQSINLSLSGHRASYYHRYPSCNFALSGHRTCTWKTSLFFCSAAVQNLTVDFKSIRILR